MVRYYIDFNQAWWKGTGFFFWTVPS